LLLDQQLQDTALDFIAGLAHRFGPLSFRVWQWPVVTSQSGNVWALIAATHRNKHFGILGLSLILLIVILYLLFGRARQRL
jgi:hypothetical protein